MKTITRILTAAFVATLIVSAFGQQSSMPGMKMKTQTKKAPVAAQKVTVTVDNGFTPAEIKVKAGKPVELTFDTKHKGCAATVVFKSLKLTEKLTDGKKTTVKFTPKKAGTIEFACGMGMYKGSVVAK